MAELAPERTFHVGGLSKTVAAGVRGGWVSCPANFAPRVQTAHKMVTGGIPFLLGELASELVLSGEADAIRADVRREIEGREAIARQSFAGLEFNSHRLAPFLWMKLPEPWLSTTFKNAAANEGVLIDDEDEYKPGRTERIYHRIRVGFSAPTTPPGRAERLLHHPPPGRPRQCRLRPLWLKRVVAAEAGAALQPVIGVGVRLDISGSEQPVERRHEPCRIRTNQQPRHLAPGEMDDMDAGVRGPHAVRAGVGSPASPPRRPYSRAGR